MARPKNAEVKESFFNKYVGKYQPKAPKRPAYGVKNALELYLERREAGLGINNAKLVELLLALKNDRRMSDSERISAVRRMHLDFKKSSQPYGTKLMNVMISCYGRAQNPETNEPEWAYEVYEDGKEQAEHTVADVYTMNSLIAVYGAANQTDRAFEVYEELKATGIVPDVVTLSALIQAAGYSRQLDKALETFNSATEMGVSPNTATLSKLMGACELSGEYGKAKEAYDSNPKLQADSKTSPKQRYWQDRILKLAEA